MTIPRTLVIRVTRELLHYAALGLVVLAVIFLSENLRRHLDLLIAVGFRPADVAGLVRGLAGMVAPYVLPIAFLFGVLLTVGRMAADSELTAMRACGIGVRAVLAPIAALGVGVSCATWVLAVDVEHRSRRELRDVVQRMASRTTMVEPGRFHRLGSRVIYAEGRDGLDALEGVVLSDRTDPQRPLLIFAERGRFSLDERRGELRLSLENGDIHVDPSLGPGERYQRIAFDHFESAFDVGDLLRVAFSTLRPYDMTLDELRTIAARADAGDPLHDLVKKSAADYRTEMHRRFALPFAPILFAGTGVALGSRRRRGARSLGALLCALVAFGYYALLTFGQFVALRGAVPAWLGLWLPNLVLALVTGWLLFSARRAEL